MFSYWISYNVTIATRLLLISLRPLSNSCRSGLDDLLTRGIWWSSPAESHLIESPSNGNNFKPTSQIIRHFSRRTWFWSKLSSQQTHLYLITVEVLQGDGGTKGGRGTPTFFMCHVLEQFESSPTCKSESRVVTDLFAVSLTKKSNINIHHHICFKSSHERRNIRCHTASCGTVSCTVLLFSSLAA